MKKLEDIGNITHMEILKQNRPGVVKCYNYQCQILIIGIRVVKETFIKCTIENHVIASFPQFFADIAW